MFEGVDTCTGSWPLSFITCVHMLTENQCYKVYSIGDVSSPDLLCLASANYLLTSASLLKMHCVVIILWPLTACYLHHLVPLYCTCFTDLVHECLPVAGCGHFPDTTCVFSTVLTTRPVPLHSQQPNSSWLLFPFCCLHTKCPTFKKGSWTKDAK